MIYDISPPITQELAVWPGDTPLTRQILLDIANGDNLTLSTLHSTVHLGSHVDGPNHYGLGERGIGEQSLEAYIGPCQVVHINVERGKRIEPDQMKMSIKAERVLIATGTYPDPNHFDEDFAGLSPELVDKLHDEGVILVGIDTPSVDLFESKDLSAHKRFLKNKIAILEGIVLKDVPDGIYELVALPLKLIGFDASPVRAILREKGDLKHGGPRRATEEDKERGNREGKN